jgi:hypothetical protein
MTPSYQTRRLDEVSAIESTVQEVLTQPEVEDYIMTRLLYPLRFQWIGTLSHQHMMWDQIEEALTPIFHARVPAAFTLDSGGYIYDRPHGDLYVFHPDPNILEFFQSHVPALQVHDHTIPCQHLCDVWPLAFIYVWAWWDHFVTDLPAVEKFLLSLLQTFPQQLTHFVKTQLVADYGRADVPVYQILAEAYDQEGVDLVLNPTLFKLIS